MSEGYIHIHRRAWSSAAYEGDEFSRREAWFWLIAQAAWKPREMRVGSHVIPVERGQCAFSLRYLAQAWGWSLKRVRTFLKAGQKREEIGLKTGTHHTLITICNYCDYQAASDAEGTMGAQRGHNEGTNKKKVIREEGKKGGSPLDPPKPSRGTRLPDDWTLPDDWRRWAMENTSMKSGDVDHEADRFRDYWIAVGGQRGVKRDWLATWRNWCRNAKPRPGYQPQRGHRDPVLAEIERIQAEGDRGGLDGGRDAPTDLSATDMGTGRGPVGSSAGVIIDLHPVRSGGPCESAAGPDRNIGGTAGPGGNHGPGLRVQADGLSALDRVRSGPRLV